MENFKGDITQTETSQKKQRKTIDDYLGINGLLVVAIIGAFISGSIFAPIGAVCGLTAIYYLVKRRKEIDKKQKYIGWILVVLWLILFGLTNPQ